MSPPSAHTARVAARLDGVVELDLELTGSDDVLEGVRELRLCGDLAGFVAWPGQDVMVSVPPQAPSPRFRRYTMRRWDAEHGTLHLWVTTTSEGPGATWALTARKGAHVDAVGPRGKIALDHGAMEHLFVIDDSGLAAMCAMAESVRSGATVRVVLALEHATGAVPGAITPDVASGVTLRATSCDRLDPGRFQAAVAEACAGMDLSTTAAYVFGELDLTRRTAATLEGLGADPARLAAKPYWRADRANEANGEPDRGSE